MMRRMETKTMLLVALPTALMLVVLASIGRWAKNRVDASPVMVAGRESERLSRMTDEQRLTEGQRFLVAGSLHQAHRYLAGIQPTNAAVYATAQSKLIEVGDAFESAARHSDALNIYSHIPASSPAYAVAQNRVYQFTHRANLQHMSLATQLLNGIGSNLPTCLTTNDCVRQAADLLRVARTNHTTINPYATWCSIHRELSQIQQPTQELLDKTNVMLPVVGRAVSLSMADEWNAHRRAGGTTERPTNPTDWCSWFTAHTANMARSSRRVEYARQLDQAFIASGTNIEGVTTSGPYNEVLTIRYGLCSRTFMYRFMNNTNCNSYDPNYQCSGGYDRTFGQVRCYDTIYHYVTEVYYPSR